MCSHAVGIIHTIQEAECGGDKTYIQSQILQYKPTYANVWPDLEITVYCVLDYEELGV